MLPLPTERNPFLETPPPGVCSNIMCVAVGTHTVLKAHVRSGDNTVLKFHVRSGGNTYSAQSTCA
jgi:hypothetical protein